MPKGTLSKKTANMLMKLPVHQQEAWLKVQLDEATKKNEQQEKMRAMKPRTLANIKKRIRNSKIFKEIRKNMTTIDEKLREKLKSITKSEDIEPFYQNVKNLYYSYIATEKWQVDDETQKTAWNSTKDEFTGLLSSFDPNDEEKRNNIDTFFEETLQKFRKYATYQNKQGQKIQVPLGKRSQNP